MRHQIPEPRGTGVFEHTWSMLPVGDVWRVGSK
jgi:hypothetical protein